MSSETMVMRATNLSFGLCVLSMEHKKDMKYDPVDGDCLRRASLRALLSDLPFES
jgi:hypothetical protein